MLGTQHQFIIDLLSDGKPHCSNEIPFRDYRRRVQDLIDGKNNEHKKYAIKKEACRGRCGRQHGSLVNWLWLEQIEETFRGRETETHRSHNPKIAGSTPAPGPKPQQQTEWTFESETDPGKKYHVIDFTTCFVCDCIGYTYRKTCKHIEKVKEMLKAPPQPIYKETKLF